MCCLKTLSFDQLSISDLLIFIRLLLDDSNFMLWQDFHLGLFEGLLDQDIEHGFNLLIKVEKFIVAVVDLRWLAIILRRHTGVEKRHWGSIQIELGHDTDLFFIRLVSKHLFKFIGLDEQVLTAIDWLWGAYFPVGVLENLTKRVELSLQILTD
jgi:hypothetical protein